MPTSHSYAAMPNPAVKRKSAKTLHHLEMTPAENGGMTVTHHFDGYDHQPETHVFAAGEGKKALAHIGKHMGMADIAKAEKMDSVSGDTDD